MIYVVSVRFNQQRDILHNIILVTGSIVKAVDTARTALKLGYSCSFENTGSMVSALSPDKVIIRPDLMTTRGKKRPADFPVVFTRLRTVLDAWKEEWFNRNAQKEYRLLTRKEAAIKRERDKKKKRKKETSRQASNKAAFFMKTAERGMKS